MTRSLTAFLVSSLTVAAAQKAAAGAADAANDHVLVLHDSSAVSLKDVLGVFESKLGVPAQQAMPLVQKINAEGSAVVLMGPETTCKKIAALFEEVKMKATVRPKTEADVPKAPPGEYAGSEVAELDTAQFKQAFSGTTPHLVAFFAPWCGPCKAMVPEFKGAARQLAGSGVSVGAVDCEANREVAQMLSIQGYPTVAFVVDGKQTVYKGPRTAMEISGWARQQMTAYKVKSAVSGVINGAKAGVSKLLRSKVLANQPAAAAAA